MKNLLAARQFFSDVFGAVCFYNDRQDGYIAFSDGRKSIETLSIYFPNKLDLYDLETKKRLTNAVGENFYERYCGAKSRMLCGLYSSQLMVAYYYDNKVIGIHSYNHLGLKGSVDRIFNYFCGVNLNLYAENERCFSASVCTNNNIKIETGYNIQNVVESYLNEIDYKFDEYFRLDVSLNYPVLEQQKRFKQIDEIYGTENSNFCLCAKRRAERFSKLMGALSKEDLQEFYNDIEIGKTILKKD